MQDYISGEYADDLGAWFEPDGANVHSDLSSLRQKKFLCETPELFPTDPFSLTKFYHQIRVSEIKDVSSVDGRDEECRWSMLRYEQLPQQAIDRRIENWDNLHGVDGL